MTNFQLSERTIMGYEYCVACNWVNLFWTDQPYQRRLIPGHYNDYDCPRCHSVGSGRYAGYAVPTPYAAIFDEPPPTSSLPRLKFAQHLSALARWLLPWSADQQGWLSVVTPLLGLTFGIAKLTGSAVVANGVLTAIIAIFGWLAASHILLTAVIVIITMAINRHDAHQSIADIWREQATKPWLPGHHTRRVRRRMIRQWRNI